MFGSLYFGQSYFGSFVDIELPGDARSDCGGAFGSATFGQPYFGGHLQCNPPAPDGPTTRPNCGGIFGSATFGQPYFGCHYECNVFPVPPPTPPVVVEPESHGGGAPPYELHFHDRPRDLRTERQKTAEEWERAQIESDDDEIAFIIGVWISLK